MMPTYAVYKQYWPGNLLLNMLTVITEMFQQTYVSEL
jgi:hypothetical protein